MRNPRLDPYVPRRQLIERPIDDPLDTRPHALDPRAVNALTTDHAIACDLEDLLEHRVPHAVIDRFSHAWGRYAESSARQSPAEALVVKN